MTDEQLSKNSEVRIKAAAECSRLGAKLLYVTRSGSHLYGTNTPESDDDFVGLFLPSKSSLYLQKAPKHISLNTKQSEGAKNEKGDTDCTLYSIQYFFELLEGGDSNMVSLLFSHTNRDTYVLNDTTLFGSLEYDKLLTSKLKGMVGYTKGQMYKYSLKGVRYNVANAVLDYLKGCDPNETLGKYNVYNVVTFLSMNFHEDVSKYLSVWSDYSHEERVDYLNVLGKKLNSREKVSKHIEVLENVVKQYGHRAQKAALEKADLKAMYHAARVSDEVMELHQTGKLRYPLKNRDYYMAIRNGTYELDEVSEYLETNFQYITEYEEGIRTSKLPDSLDRNYMDSVILSMYR